MVINVQHGDYAESLRRALLITLCPASHWRYRWSGSLWTWSAPRVILEATYGPWWHVFCLTPFMFFFELLVRFYFKFVFIIRPDYPYTFFIHMIPPVCTSLPLGAIHGVLGYILADDTVRRIAEEFQLL